MGVFRAYIQCIIISVWFLSPFAAQAAVTLLSEIQEGPDSIQLVFTGAVPSYKVFNLSDPERIVLDLAMTKNGIGSRSIDNSNRMMKQIRFGDHPDKLRVVIDLSDSKAKDFEIVKQKSSLMIASKKKVAIVVPEQIVKKKVNPVVEKAPPREVPQRVKKSNMSAAWSNNLTENRIGLGLYGDIFNEAFGLQAKYWHTEWWGAEVRYGTGLYTEYSVRGLGRYQIIDPLWIYGGLGYKHVERTIKAFGVEATPGADVIELSAGLEYIYKRSSFFVEAAMADIELGATIRTNSGTYDTTLAYQPITLVTGVAWYFY